MVFDQWVHARLDRRFVRRQPVLGLPDAASAVEPPGVREPGARGAVADFAAAVVLGVADAVTIWAGRLTR
jgi:hypothetical protein